MTGGSVDKVDAFGGKMVDVGGNRFGIAGKATGVVAQLVGKNVDEVGWLGMHDRWLSFH